MLFWQKYKFNFVLNDLVLVQGQSENLMELNKALNTYLHIYGALLLLLFSHVGLFPVPWTVAHQDLLSMEFSRQEYWSG